MNIYKKQSVSEVLMQLFQYGLNAVNGCNAVEKKLGNYPLKGKVSVLAVGKAAASMMLGAKNNLKQQLETALIITKKGYTDQSLNIDSIEAGHPVPNEKSLKAGTALLSFIEKIPNDTQFLALISGGASALVEVLPEGMQLDDLQKLNQWLLASGLDIHKMNRIRQAVSLIKGGKALQHLKLKEMTQFLISDVKFDDPKIIGSGLFSHSEHDAALTNIPGWLETHIQTTNDVNNVNVDTHIIANNEIACKEIIKQAEVLAYTTFYHGQTLYGDVFVLAKTITAELLNAKIGLHVWGGEPTITLPENSGRGGRNQSLALALAYEIENTKGLTILIAATDGSDGPTEDAGAIVDGQTIQASSYDLDKAQESLRNADAGTFLAEAGALVSTGVTGTNVMDIVIAIKE